MNVAIKGELAATTSRLPIESNTTTNGIGCPCPRRASAAHGPYVIHSVFEREAPHGAPKSSTSTNRA
jgi:hypothetical protein